MILSADFETTTDPNDCRVWAWGVTEIGNIGYYKYGTTIDSFFDYIQQDNHTLYFHNLKFDGEFILNYLFRHGYHHIEDKKDKADKTFTTLISDKGQFYTMTIYFKVQKRKTQKVTIYDSLKIIPFSVDQIAKSFSLPISKLSIDYQEKRPINHQLTKEEIAYLKNDITIVALALDTLFQQGLTKMTQGSNALHNFKTILTVEKFKRYFPIPDYLTDKYIRESYKGGFTYVKSGIEDQDISEGIVLDVNSLYPSVMRYEAMPYGKPIFFRGRYKDNILYNLYIQMFSCKFELKKDHIPTLQLKNNLSFIPTQYLTSSHGDEIVLCMTSIDLKLFLDHYDVSQFEYISGYMFKSAYGIFDDYIDYWTSQKINAKKEGNKGIYTLSKLMLNALYGKFALNPNVQSKIPFLDDGIIKYYLGKKETRDPIYIPIGTFVTSYARYKTISSAQKVFDRFLYADTDSLHLKGLEIPDNLEIDDLKLGAWKWEYTFLKARYLRQKSYIEYGHDMKSGEIDGDNYWKVTCAGMPESLHDRVTWENFHEGLSIDGKLQPKHVAGGIILSEIDFSIKKSYTKKEG